MINLSIEATKRVANKLAGFAGAFTDKIIKPLSKPLSSGIASLPAKAETSRNVIGGLYTLAKGTGKALENTANTLTSPSKFTKNVVEPTTKFFFGLPARAIAKPGIDLASGVLGLIQKRNINPEYQPSEESKQVLGSQVIGGLTKETSELQKSIGGKSPIRQGASLALAPLIKGGETALDVLTPTILSAALDSLAVYSKKVVTEKTATHILEDASQKLQRSGYDDIATEIKDLPHTNKTPEELFNSMEDVLKKYNALEVGRNEADIVGSISDIQTRIKGAADLAKVGVTLPSPVEPFNPKLENPVPIFKGFKDLTTKVLERLKGKSVTSKQEILDFTNMPELKQTERDLIRNIVNEYKEAKIPVKEFANKVKTELLPLKTVSMNKSSIPTSYENITLPNELRGKIMNYDEHVYNSPIKTSAGDVHWSSYDPSVQGGYFGHTRIEDMADNQTRRVIEVQSDLYQKGNLEREMATLPVANDSQFFKKFNLDESELTPAQKKIAQEQNLRRTTREQELSKLQQYNDPTAHFRMIREEVKQAAKDGKTKLQFPTGETAMKIEGLGETGAERWTIDNSSPLMPNELKVGLNIHEAQPGLGMIDEAGDGWIITDVLGDGKFKAVPKNKYDEVMKGPGEFDWKDSRLAEEFDISGKVDTSNPIYRFYEKEIGRYLTSKYGAKRIKDAQGVEWYEIPVDKSFKSKAIEALGLIGGVGLIGKEATKKD